MAMNHKPMHAAQVDTEPFVASTHSFSSAQLRVQATRRGGARTYHAREATTETDVAAPGRAPHAPVVQHVLLEKGGAPVRAGCRVRGGGKEKHVLNQEGGRIPVETKVRQAS